MIAFIEVRILHVLLMRLAQCCLRDPSFKKGERHLAFKNSSFLSPAASGFTLPGMYKRGIASVRYKVNQCLAHLRMGKTHSAALHSFKHCTSEKMWTYQKELRSK